MSVKKDETASVEAILTAVLTAVSIRMRRRYGSAGKVELCSLGIFAPKIWH